MIPFERYDEEFASLTSQVTSKLRALDDVVDDVESSHSSGSRSGKGGGGNNYNEADVRMAHALLCQADDLLKQMGLEARGVEDASMKRDLLGKVRGLHQEGGQQSVFFFRHTTHAHANTLELYISQVRVCKARLANLRDDYERAKSNVERSNLGLGPSSDHRNNNNGHGSNNGNNNKNSRMISKSNTQLLESQSKTLENARSIMAETESVALEITDELGRHRETIASSQSRVRQVTGLTNRARRIVQGMSRREVQQKLVLYSVAGVVIVVFLILVYGMFR